MSEPKRISVRIELASRKPLRPSPERAELDGNLGTPVVAVMLAVKNVDSPTGAVQLGALRWRFTNRVEMLEAVDAAFEEAIQASS